jgi:hypothetical protein
MVPYVLVVEVPLVDEVVVANTSVAAAADLVAGQVSDHKPVYRSLSGYNFEGGQSRRNDDERGVEELAHTDEDYALHGVDCAAGVKAAGRVLQAEFESVEP